MKSYLCVCFLATIIAVALALPQNRYTTKYDNIDVDKILGNDRILTSYIKCLQDKGACTAEGRELKGNYITLIILFFLIIHILWMQ